MTEEVDAELLRMYEFIEGRKHELADAMAAVHEDRTGATAEQRALVNGFVALAQQVLDTDASP